MTDLFQKQEKLKYDRSAFLKKLTYFKTHRLKMLEFYNGMMERSKIDTISNILDILTSSFVIYSITISNQPSTIQLNHPKQQSSCLRIKLNFLTKIYKLLFCFSVFNNSVLSLFYQCFICTVPFEMLHIPLVESSSGVCNIAGENLCLINNGKNQIT